MTTTRKMIKALLWSVLILLFSFAQVSQAVAQTCTPPQAGLVSWWPFDETSGTTAADVQDGNPGTLIGGPTFTPGFVGNALDFTGVNAYVEIVNASNLNFGNGSFTVEAWFNYPTVPLGLVYLIDHGASNMVTPSEAGWAVFVTGGGQIGFDLRDQAGQVGGRPMGSAPAPSAGVWHQVVLVVDRANNLATLFVDGAPGASAVIPASFGSMNNNGNPAIGAINRGGAATGGSPGGFFNGLIDEVAIHNRALSTSEIEAIFNAGSAGKCKFEFFSAFAGMAEANLGPLPNDDIFDVSSTFTLGTGNDGINPLAEDVILQVGSFDATILAGSFELDAAGNFNFEGVVDGVSLEVKIIPLGGSTFDFTAMGANADLTGTVVPLTVGYVIGDDGIITTLETVEVVAE